MTDLISRVPPHSLEAEIGVLGSLLLDRGALSELGDLQPVHFYREGHRRIFAAMLALHEQAAPIDLISLKDALQKRGQLDEVGGVTYLAGLGDQVPTSAYAGHYARLVREKAHLRDLIGHAGKVMQAAYEGHMDLEDLQERASHPPDLSFAQNRFVRLGQVAADVLFQAETGGGPVGLPTGLSDLDRDMNGLEPGRLYVLGARPAMGKSSLAFQVAAHVAKCGHRVLGFSLEMPAEEIACRILASESKVGLEHLTRARRGQERLSDREQQRLTQALARLDHARLDILPKPGLTLGDLTREIEREHAREPISLFVLDYVQLVAVAGESNGNARVSQVSTAMKRLALELNIPVLILSQLNRELEKRPNRRPQLSDLRESGSLEQDADVVLFIYRDEVYNPNTDQQGIAELILGKQRNGPTGTVKAQFHGQLVKFQDLKAHEPQGGLYP